MLRRLSDSKSGITAQVEYANHRLIRSLESRARAVDDLLLELRGDLLRFWIPLVCGATLLIGQFSGMGIQGCWDSYSDAATAPTPATVQLAATPQPDKSGGSDSNSEKSHHNQHDAKPDAGHKKTEGYMHYNAKKHPCIHPKIRKA